MDDIEAKQLYKQYDLKGIDFSKIGKIVGYGAHGHVYRYGRDKAIKFTSAYSNSDLIDMKRFVSVARRFKAIPKIYSMGGCAEFYWVIMEYLPRELSTAVHYSMVDKIEYSLYNGHLVRGLTVSWKKLTKSLLRLNKKYGYRHDDIQENNFRLTKNGEPKAIDLESFLPY